MKIPFSPPYIDPSVEHEVLDSLRSGWITTGPKVKALEELIERQTGAARTVCVNSWTSGAILVLRWLGLQAGDEVIIPAYTYSATALAVLHAGGRPVMVDIADDFNIATDAIRAAITPRTKAIIPVDIAGYPCDYDAIAALVQEEDVRAQFVPTSPVQRQLGRILILSDAAHSLGATARSGKKSGACCDVTIFSLHAVKNVTTAEGGAICLNLPPPFDNDRLYADMRLMTLNCQTKDAFSKSQAGGWRYDIVGLGMKCNMPDVNAAIGLAQLRQYDTLLEARRRVFRRYAQALANDEWALIPPSADGLRESSYHLFALRVKGLSEGQRDAMIAEIARREVAVNVHFVPLPLLSLFRDLGYRIDDYPRAYANYACEISLPIYPQLTEEMQDFVIRALRDAYATVKG